jgi:hypothetical protein
LVNTASLPMTTPCSFAPISAPHIHQGCESRTALVCSTCGIEIQVQAMSDGSGPWSAAGYQRGTCDSFGSRSLFFANSTPSGVIETSVSHTPPTLQRRPSEGPEVSRSTRHRVTVGGVLRRAVMTMTFQEACEAVCAPGTRFEIQETDVRGVPTKVFAGTPPNIRYLFAAAAARTDDFIVFEDERWPMPRVTELIGQIGHALVAELGVAKGDRVAIAMRNYPEWIAAFAAITSVGAVAVPMNAWWQTDEMVFALADSGSTIVIADADRLNRMRAAEAGSIDRHRRHRARARRASRRRPFP